MIDFPINYGVMAVNQAGQIVHFCAYAKPITDQMIKGLKQELATDPAFGLIDQVNDLVIMEAPPEVIEEYRIIVGGISGDNYSEQS